MNDKWTKVKIEALRQLAHKRATKLILEDPETFAITFAREYEQGIVVPAEDIFPLIRAFKLAKDRVITLFDFNSAIAKLEEQAEEAKEKEEKEKKKEE